MEKTFSALAVLAILLSYSGIRAATSNVKAAKQPAAAAADNAPADTTLAANYTGTIVVLLNGSLYILRDDVNQTWYHLDDQEMPSKFLGKKVVVTGRLDPAVNMIRVRDIEPANT
jgi:hypothetical protein